MTTEKLTEMGERELDAITGGTGTQSPDMPANKLADDGQPLVEVRKIPGMHKVSDVTLKRG